MAKLSWTHPRPGRKHRVHNWINTTTLEPMYGVQCNVTYGLWAHVVDGKQLVLFESRDDAAKAAKDWSAEPDLHQG